MIAGGYHTSNAHKRYIYIQVRLRDLRRSRRLANYNRTRYTSHVCSVLSCSLSLSGLHQARARLLSQAPRATGHLALK